MSIETAKLFLKAELSEESMMTLLLYVSEIIRELPIEKQQKYAVLWLFCDWTINRNLADSIPGLMIIKRLNEKLAELKDVADKNVLTKELKGIISSKILKTEIESFLETFGLSSGFLDTPRRWRNFENTLAEIIHNKPMSFPRPANKPGGISKLKLLFSNKSANKKIASLNIIYIDNSFVSKESTPFGGKIRSLVLLTEGGERFILPL